MSVNPVGSIGPMTGAESARPRSAQVTPQVPAGAAHRSESGSGPKPEAPAVQAASSVREMPQDEVQVQRDSQTNDQIVIRYVDGSGNLILQVPSSEVLNLARSIAQTFEQQETSRADRVEATNGQGGNSRGH